MTAPVLFEYEGRQVRTVEINGEPWFVAADVCAVLGYRNGPDAVANHVRAGQRRSERIASTGAVPFQNQIVINEGGLYRLIMRSDMPSADAFQDWVTDEVLPQIRRTGAYIARPASTIDVLRAALDQIEAAQQAAQRAELAATSAAEESRVTAARLDAIEGRHEWFAALGYAKLNGLPTSAVWLQRLGTTAGQVGRAQGIAPNRVQHALYGEVNQWPAHVWEEAVRLRRAAGDLS